MKKKTTAKPTASKFSLLRQISNFIPPHLVPKLARTGVENHARTFSPWSHVVSLLYAQITHALRLHSGPLLALRGATPTPKNTLSHANRRAHINFCGGRLLHQSGYRGGSLHEPSQSRLATGSYEHPYWWLVLAAGGSSELNPFCLQAQIPPQIHP
jgi:hypothetical protein